MAKGFDGRLEVVAQRCHAASTAAASGGGELSEDGMARAVCILEDLYGHSPETRRVRAMFGEDVWNEMVTAARAVVTERGLTL